jgi:hypothetical protein
MTPGTRLARRHAYAFDVDPAGRLLLIENPRAGKVAPRLQIEVVLNWIETLRRLAPTR